MRVWTPSAGELRVVETHPAFEFEVEPPEARGLPPQGAPFGLALDLGTTTLVASLVDLRSGDELATVSALNPQRAFGHDVLSRIGYAQAHGPEAVRTPLLRELNRLAEELLASVGGTPRDILEATVGGNTAMLHLFAGEDASGMATAPYEPVLLERVTRLTTELGLAALGEAPITLLPGVSAFVGADVVAGVLATRLWEVESAALYLDLGTNGEIVLVTPTGLVATSTAAGPAFEGASISSGMLAESGAIERVRVDGGRLGLSVIDGVAPRGLCGSGVIDLVAILVDEGVLDSTGRLRLDVPGPLGSLVSEDAEGNRRFLVDESAGVGLTQDDVRQVQLAKAAISAGMRLLLEAEGVAPSAVETVLVAGGLGRHLDPRSLAKLGVIDDEWTARVRFVGNAAKAGVVGALLSTGARMLADRLAEEIRVFDLAAHMDFERRFLSAIDFPRT